MTQSRLVVRHPVVNTRHAVVEPAEPASPIRETFASLPAVFQPFLTWLTGKPYEGQEPLIRHTPWSQTLLAFLQLFGGMAASIALLYLGSWWLLLVPVAWIVTTGAARKLQITICHGAVHSAFMKNDTADRIFIEVISTLLLIQDYTGYRRDHRHTHHGKDLATLDDPDVQFMITLGLKPGASVPELWRALFWNMVSPRYHALFLYYRLKSNFWTCPTYRKVMSVVFHATVLTLVAIYDVWLAYLVGWVIPILFVYHVAALLQFTCEHFWLQVRRPEDSAKVYLARLTTGRFMGEPAPSPDLAWYRKPAAWLWWGLKMCTFHLFGRIFVVVSDMPAHDWHHRYPSSRDWPNAIYARQRDIETGGSPQWQEPYTELWGLNHILNNVFVLFSSLPPVKEGQRGHMKPEDLEEVLNAM